MGTVGCGFMYRCKGGHVGGRSEVMGDVTDGKVHGNFLLSGVEFTSGVRGAVSSRWSK